MRLAHWLWGIGCLLELIVLIALAFWGPGQSPAERTGKSAMRFARQVSLGNLALDIEHYVQADTRNGQVHLPEPFLTDLASRTMPQAEFGPYQLVIGIEKAPPLQGAYLEILDVVDKKEVYPDSDLIVAAFHPEDGYIQYVDIESIALPYFRPQKPVRFIGLHGLPLGDLKRYAEDKGWGL
jgi:hypothetical protein